MCPVHAGEAGLRSLPLRDFAANQIWLELVALAADLLAWTHDLALGDTPAQTWEPKRLRLRLLKRRRPPIGTGRRHLLRLPLAGPGPINCCSGSTGTTRWRPDLPHESDDQGWEAAADAELQRALSRSPAPTSTDEDHERS